MKARPWAIGKMSAFVCANWHAKIIEVVRQSPRQSNKSFAHWGSVAAAAMLYATLLVPVTAQQVGNQQGNQQQGIPVYPAGPPFRPVPGDDFQGRDLQRELANKMTDMFTVTSVGDMY